MQLALGAGASWLAMLKVLGCVFYVLQIIWLVRGSLVAFHTIPPQTFLDDQNLRASLKMRPLQPLQDL